LLLLFVLLAQSGIDVEPNQLCGLQTLVFGKGIQSLDLLSREPDCRAFQHWREYALTPYVVKNAFLIPSELVDDCERIDSKFTTIFAGVSFDSMHFAAWWNVQDYFDCAANISIRGRSIGFRLWESQTRPK
jgi:hypothetical protein